MNYLRGFDAGDIEPPHTFHSRYYRGSDDRWFNLEVRVDRDGSQTETFTPGETELQRFRRRVGRRLTTLRVVGRKLRRQRRPYEAAIVDRSPSAYWPLDDDAQTIVHWVKRDPDDQ